MVELGPGKGTLMDDMLRTLESIGQTRGRVQAVHLVETSARLREEQKNRLSSRISEASLHWYDRVEDIPKDGLVVCAFAFEFGLIRMLQTTHLPYLSRTNFLTQFLSILLRSAIIHMAKLGTYLQYTQKTRGGFQEVLVDIDRTAQTVTTSSPLVNISPSKPQSSAFCYVLSGPLSPLAHTLGNSSPRFSSVPDGSRIEVSPTSWGIARTIGELISGGGGGAGLIIDYGDDRAFGSSFRAFQKHKLVDVFHQPGLCDLTANVDFAYLKEAFGSTSTHGPITQHAFLTSMGAPIRLHRLLQGAKEDETRERLRKGAARLMDLLGMGKQYKVMGVTSGEKQGQVYPFGV
ncbi:unnamed protein product [Rhizoctonia solani]|uniref:Protein arginine methyltransferase NDUFAF7 n=1 Tax=Rhizoctonia solani TaxID=456999 RepID=A0A8H3E097_9AGAM|nr:unnamed protein product [Rhizoctonia solani]